MVVMVVPFLLSVREIADDDEVHLLPTGNATLLVAPDTAVEPHRLVLPHRGVIRGRGPVALAALSPNVVKCLLGEPRRHLERTIAVTDHPLLVPFAGADGMPQVADLLRDLRDSLTVTADEHDFLDLWGAVGRGEELLTGDRRVQRLVLRYAGRSPLALNTIARLARTLDADNRTGGHNSLGAFADSSHYVRVCRSHTGRTPTAWRNMSQAFY
jgi:hypothetical protein